jgi:hypothetical protein
MTREQGIDRITGAISSSVVTLFLLYTRSRGAWVGLVVGAACAVFWIVRVRPFAIPRLTLRPILSFVIVLVSLFLVGRVEPRFDDKNPSRLDETKQSIQQTVRLFTTPGGDRDRFRIWAPTSEMALDHVVFGVGLGNWSAVYPRYDRGDVLHISSAPRRPHNDYLRIFSELGIPGIICVVWCLLRSFLIAFRHQDTWQLAGLCSAAAISAHSFFSFPREQAVLSLLLWFGLAASQMRSKQGHRVPQKLVWLVLLITSVGGTVFAYRAIEADELYARSLIAREKGRTLLQEETAAASIEMGAIDHRVFLLLADAQEKSGKLQEAIETYSSYARVQPNLACSSE